MRQTGEAVITDNKDGTITIFIPMDFSKKGSRRSVKYPAVTDQTLVRNAEQDTALLNALARAHKWNNLLLSGEIKNIAELARREGISGASYVAKIVRLALLAPDIQEAIINATHPSSLKLSDLLKLKTIPALWTEQRKCFGFT